MLNLNYFEVFEHKNYKKIKIIDENIYFMCC